MKASAGIHRNPRAGFSLMELMIVVGIIAILAQTISSVMTSVLRKTRDSKRKGDIEAIQKALWRYYDDHQNYPLTAVTGALAPNGSWCVSNDASWDVLATALLPYIDKLPKDPLNNISGQWAQTGFGYAYYSGFGNGCDNTQYMLVYKPEDFGTTPSPGITFCDGTYFNYAGTMTIGVGRH